MKIAVFLLLTGFYSSVFAGECVGKIERIFTHKNGDLAIASSDLFGNLHGRHLCNLSVSYKGVEPSVCKTWASQLLAAHASKSNIRLVYIEGECDMQDTWGNADTPHTLSSWL